MLTRASHGRCGPGLRKRLVGIGLVNVCVWHATVEEGALLVPVKGQVQLAMLVMGRIF